MPLFEYKCEKCGKVFEKLVVNHDTGVKCEDCGSEQVKKLLSTFSASVAEGAKKSCSVSECSSCCPSGTCCSL